MFSLINLVSALYTYIMQYLNGFFKDAASEVRSRQELANSLTLAFCRNLKFCALSVALQSFSWVILLSYT